MIKKKTFGKLGIDGNCISMTKGVYKKFIFNIIFSSEILSTFPVRLRIRRGYHFYHFHSTLKGSLSQCNKRRKGNKRKQ